MSSLRSSNFTFIVPHYRRPGLRNMLAKFRSKGVITCCDREDVTIPGGTVTLYLNDQELSRDSGILVRAKGYSFLNLNDCKIQDEIPSLLREKGKIDVYTCQFSGASWHPTCYQYPCDRYERISRKKMESKFESVARSIEWVQPRIFLPAAGPPCFLDPQLFHLNFETVNIFPRAPQFIEFLNQRLPNVGTCWAQMMPGDVLDVPSGEVVSYGTERVSEESHEDYIRAYAAEYKDFFAQRQLEYSFADIAQLMEALKGELKEKLEAFTLRHQVRTPLYIGLSDIPDKILRVDFTKRSVAYASAIQEDSYYSLKAPSWEIARVLDRCLMWEDLLLTFRVTLNRSPDVYQTVMNGYLTMEPEDIKWFCEKLLEIENSKERIIIEAGGLRYSINRYCPHQGGDLSQGWVEDGRYLICPRHRWRYDLQNEGKCLMANVTINAICLEEE